MKKLLLLTAICLLISCNKLNKGIIIDKHYEADWYSLDYDPTLKMTITNYHPAEYYLIVRGVYREQPKTESFCVGPYTWLSASIGDSITIK